MFSIFFIHRPIFAKVISIFIIIVGLIALYVLPIAEFPEMTPPSVKVSATYTGGNALTVEESVTTPLEEKINGVPGMIYMDSNSSADGTSTITIYFESGYDLDVAAIDVQNKVELAKPTLPESVKNLGVKTVKSSSSIVQILTVQSSNPQHDALYLSNFSNINIVEELKQIKGIGEVTNLGEKKYAMRIWLNPNKLSQLGITIPEVTQAIREQNIDSALGSIGKSPMPAENMFEYTIVSKTKLSNVEEFENIIIKENKDGTKVKMIDIAKVELGAENYGWYADLNGGPATLLGIYQLPGANALDIAKNVAAKLKQLQDRFPEEISVAATYDTTEFIEVSIREVVITLFQALALVLLVVYIFLQSFRTTIIPALAIPVSLVGTFALLLAMDFSINTLTLFGLILAIGIVVDDAIIVVENVETNLAKDPNITLSEATTKAMKEIFAPVVSTTLVLLAVFIPVTFIPGISGALYQQFATTISFAVIFSSISALTLSPALCATVLKRKDPNRTFVLFAKFNNGLDWFKGIYKKMLHVIARFWYIAYLLFFLGIGATYVIFNVLPTGFIPEEDKGTLVASIDIGAGASLQKNQKILDEIIPILQETPGITDVLSIGGYNLLSSTVDSSYATIFLVLDNWDNRTTYETSIEGIMKSVKEKTAHIDDANVNIFNMPAIPGISAVGGFEIKLQNLQSAPMEEFNQIATNFIQKANQDERIMYAFTFFKDTYPQYYVDINREKVSSLNVKINDVFEVLQTYLGSAYINDFNKFGKVYRVYVQAEQSFRTEQNDISNFFVKNSENEMVPLSAFVTLSRQSGTNLITHFNTYRSIAINGVHNIPGGFSTGDALEALEEIAAEVLPRGYSFEWSGMSLQEKEAGNAAAFIFLLSIMVVYLFLAAQYESWMMPIMIMAPIPVVMLGALATNMYSGLLNDTYTQIGLVLLIGMSSKNAILIVEFAKELRESGESIVNSGIEAAIQRLRPILMTIFSFLLGILPLVIATGAGAAARQSLGTAVFGGMIMSTVLTLFFTPILYITLQKLREKFSGNKEEIINEKV